MFPANAHDVLSDSQATLAWSIALNTVVESARLGYPQELKRINGGFKLITSGAVRVLPTKALVQSQSVIGKTYTVEDTCACSWFTYGARIGEHRRCAHRWAYLLYTHGVDVLVNMYASIYTTVDEDGTLHESEGFARAVPGETPHLFFSTSTGAHRFLPSPCSNLTLLGKVAWIEDGKLCGSLPQAVLDLAPAA